MNTNEDSRPKTRNRMLLYIILAGVGFAMGNLTVEMFPSKEAHRWAMFGLGFTNAVALAIRTFIDRTPSEESEEKQMEKDLEGVSLSNRASGGVTPQAMPLRPRPETPERPTL